MKGTHMQGEDVRLLGCPASAEEAERLRSKVDGMGKYDTMDLELRNSPLLQDIRSRQTRRTYRQLLAGRWLVVVIAGVAIGLLCFFFNWAVRGLWLALYRATERVIRHTDDYGPAYGTYMAFTLFYALLATLPVVFVASGGLADGGGISELQAHFNGIYTKGLMNFRPALAQLWSGVFVNGANIVGVGEAPLVHVSAALSASVTRVLRSGWLAGVLGKLQMKRLTSLFDNEKDNRDFVSTGAAAGFSIAFVTPIAGALFPVEQGGLAFSPSRLFMAFLSSCIALLVLMVGVMLHQRPGSFWEYRLFDMFAPANTNVVGGSYYVYIWELPIFVAMGVIAGLLGAAFVQLNVRIRHLRRRFMPWDSPRQWLRCVEVLLIAAVTGTVWFSVCWASPCAPKPSPAAVLVLQPLRIPNSLLQLAARVNDPFPQLWCPAGQYNQYGTIFWQPLQATVRILIDITAHAANQFPDPALPDPFLPNKALLAMFFLQLVLVTWTYGSGIAFGIFTPALTIGAALGQLTGHLVKHIAADLNGDIDIALPAYAVICAAAMLSGFTRYRVCAVVLVAELSGAISLVPVIALASAVATGVGNRLSKGIYDAYNDDNHAPILGDPVTDNDLAIVADRLTAGDVMASGVVTLPPIVTVGKLIKCLREHEHHTYPVTPEPGSDASGAFPMLGVVTRKALLKMVVHRRRFAEGDEAAQARSGHASSESESNSLPDWSESDRDKLMAEVRPFSTAAYIDEEPYIREVPKSDYDQKLDLRPFMNQSPLVLPKDTSFLQIYHIFRHLGCHEVFVAPHAPDACGVITRKDITQENGQLALWWRKQEARKGSFLDVESGGSSSDAVKHDSGNMPALRRISVASPK